MNLDKYKFSITKDKYLYVFEKSKEIVYIKRIYMYENNKKIDFIKMIDGTTDIYTINYIENNKYVVTLDSCEKKRIFKDVFNVLKHSIVSDLIVFDSVLKVVSDKEAKLIKKLDNNSI